MALVDDNQFPKVIYKVQATDQSAPSNGDWKMYAKADGVYARSSNAVVGPFLAASTGMTNPLTTEGDLIQSLGGTTPTRLAIGSNGMYLRSSGSNSSWARPIGFEFNYAQTIAATSITATSEATANTVLTAGAVTFDGGTVVMVDFFAPYLQVPAGNHNLVLVLYDNGSSIGLMTIATGPDATNSLRVPAHVSRRLTPSTGSHTYSVRAFVDSGTGVVHAGAGVGGSGIYMPAFIRIYRVA